MKVIKLLFSGMIFILSGCDNNAADSNAAKTLYRSINKDDTATLKIKLTDKEFYGQFEINYHGAYKDSGDVTGAVKGDTLKGTYRFQHYGIETWHITPIALLKKDGKLIMGEGALEIYMNMPYFKKNVPINYQNPRFVFEKVR
ncbi:MAG: hypothetical protein P0Y49_13215 [Candidatus Pedobacter colombiensis]|uniref:Lipoprotein n=1 Tax=Candidatus Pedobacter colombiensis TaxID=3121371 RepID=A0AAJ5W732_9SPHI|nr:hypothetical protein [Pedobacter sp.]WEK17757.1 MAG: hypothetical protein P0Y49_13215 [Pedobacter sp.]